MVLFIKNTRKKKKIIMSKTGNNATVVDVFCGIGGLSHGFYKEGFKVIAGIDIDSSCRYAFETNNNSRFIEQSIEDVEVKEISALFRKSKTKILIGCAPCQPFSTYNQKKNKDGQWRLLRDFSRLIVGVKPDIVSMENVPQVRFHKVFDQFVKNLKKEGYHVFYDVVYCPNYGIPQRRRRLVLLASKLGEITLIEKTHKPENYPTLRDAIGKLRPLRCGGVDQRDPLHRCRNLSHLNKMRIVNTPEGGDWRDWDQELRLKCHKKKSGASFSAVYGRMRWNHPASTMTTNFHNLGSGRFGHPTQARPISLREGALIQTFPKYYRFFEDESEISFNGLGIHIGNAVPVRLGRVIAKSIKKHIEVMRNDK